MSAAAVDTLMLVSMTGSFSSFSGSLSVGETQDDWAGHGAEDEHTGQ